MCFDAILGSPQANQTTQLSATTTALQLAQLWVLNIGWAVDLTSDGGTDVLLVSSLADPPLHKNYLLYFSGKTAQGSHRPCQASVYHK